MLLLVCYLFVNTHYIHVIYDICTGSGRPTKITLRVLRIAECQMQIDDETTAIQLQRILVENVHPLIKHHIKITRQAWLDF